MTIYEIEGGAVKQEEGIASLRGDRLGVAGTSDLFDVGSYLEIPILTLRELRERIGEVPRLQWCLGTRAEGNQRGALRDRDRLSISFQRFPVPMATGPSREIGSDPPAHQLPAATRLGRVRLQVADLARSLPFYEDVLGLRPIRRPDGRMVLGPQDTEVPLVELVERPGARATPRRSRLGLFHVAFLLPRREVLGQFVRHLAEKELQVGMSDHHVSEAVYLTDPDGLGVEVYADRPREKWERTDEGELAMTTEPLDTEALLSAAPAAPWGGVPAGTSVGHVHLHVGNLGRAEAFYHEALGLDKTVWSYPGALFLSAGGYHHHLGTNVWAGDVPPAGEDEAQLLEWRLVLPSPGDVEAVTRSLESAGYAATRDGEACRTEDPWGTALRIVPVDEP